MCAALAVVAPAPRIAFSTPTREILRARDLRLDQASPLETLLAAGRDVFVSRGYAGSRIDDIVAAAGVSHGTFYQYFKNKNDLAHVLVLDAMRPLASAFAGMPAAATGATRQRCAAGCAATTPATWTRRR